MLHHTGRQSVGLHLRGRFECRVSLFGMKMYIPSAEPVIDNFIRRYRDQMIATVLTGRNLFDYGARYPTDVVQLFKFSEEQHVTCRYRVGTLHDICNEPGYGSIDYSPTLDRRMSKIKVYQKLIHEIISVNPHRTLDDVSATIRTVHIRANHLQDLLQRWTDLPDELRVSRLGGVKIELTVQAESVIERCRLYCEHDLFV